MYGLKAVPFKLIRDQDNASIGFGSAGAYPE
jgi:hypothetical protein